jgi:coenzyme F420-0:L-glutamate ligase/coenzyme F420-1:gamma-L-glutamate ligase
MHSPEEVHTVNSTRPAQRLASPRVSFIPLALSETIQPDPAGSRTPRDLVALLFDRDAVNPENHDVLVVSSKVLSFFAGRQVNLGSVRPSWKSRIVGRIFKKDPAKVELLLESGSVFAVVPMAWITRIRGIRQTAEALSPQAEATRAGYRRLNAYAFVVRKHAAFLDDAGIDYCNSPDGYVSLLPNDPAASARRLRAEVMEVFGRDVAVIITDTVACIGRMGSQNIAIGHAGMQPITPQLFSNDLFGVPRAGGVDIVVDSIAGMAGLVMGQMTERIPAVIVRGLDYITLQEDDPRTTAEVLGYPRGSEVRIALCILAATAMYRFVDLVTLPRWRPREPGGGRGQPPRPM